MSCGSYSSNITQPTEITSICERVIGENNAPGYSGSPGKPHSSRSFLAINLKNMAFYHCFLAPVATIWQYFFKFWLSDCAYGYWNLLFWNYFSIFLLLQKACLIACQSLNTVYFSLSCGVTRYFSDQLGNSCYRTKILSKRCLLKNWFV